MFDKEEYTTQPENAPAETKSAAPLYRTSVRTEDMIGEQIYDPTTGKMLFEFASRTGERPTASVVGFKRRNITIRPLESSLIEKRRLLLPSGSKAYGTTAELVDRIRAHLRRCVVLSSGDEILCVSYVLFSWLFDLFDTAPYLRFIGDLGSGKSRALRVVGDLCYKPFKAGGSATMAPVFRGLELFGGCTLCMDEVDFFTRNETHQEMMTMLRQGFQRGAGVLRAIRVGDDFEPRDFDVFGPKVLAGRKNFPDAALESRCIRIYMRAGAKLDGVPEELPATYEAEAGNLRNMLLRWRQDNFFKPLREVPRLEIEPRLGQIYAPLASVIDDQAALARLQGVMLAMQAEMTESRSESLEGQVLEAVLDRTRAQESRQRTHVKDIAEDVRQERGWATPPDPRSVAAVCRRLGMEVRKDSKGSYVEFRPEEAGEILERYGLAA